MRDVIVIGAGLAGLVVAHRLRARGVDVQVVERGPVYGGHVRTVRRAGWRHEWGPNSFIGSHDALFTLAHELGLTPLEAKAAARHRYLFVDGRLQRLPEGPAEAVTSPLLPTTAKLRLLAEPLTFSKARDDESVGEFFERRLGREVVERFVDAFVSGVYAGDVTQLGMAAAFPRVWALVREHGSLFKGAVAGAKNREAHPRRGTWSFPTGLGELSDALAKPLEDRLELGADFLVERESGAWRVGPHRAPNLVVATPAHAASTLLQREAPALAAELADLRYGPIVGVHLLFKTDAIRHSLDGFGMLVPRREGLRILGVVWSSSMFPVCEPGHTALTVFVGGARDAGALDLDDTQLLALVTRDLKAAIGVEGAPVDVSIVRHPKAIPQYSTRFLPWRERVRSLVRHQPGLHVAGNWLEGVSMNETILQAESIASTVATALGKGGH